MGITLGGGGGGVSFDNMAEFPDEAKKGFPPITVPMADLPGGEYAETTVTVPDGKTMKVWALGVSAPGGSLPSGATAEMFDYSSSFSSSHGFKYKEGSPIESFDGPATIGLRSNNGNSNRKDLSSFFTATIE